MNATCDSPCCSKRIKRRKAGSGVVADAGRANLLTDVVVGGHEELDEHGHCADLDDHRSVVAGAGGDVGEGPGGLELQLGIVGALEKLHEPGHHAGPDDLVDGRTSFCVGAR
jgi:hypothetical protein